jgi:hypothetical protein
MINKRPCRLALALFVTASVILAMQYVEVAIGKVVITNHWISSSI